MNGWIEHDGSDMPKHARATDQVQVRFRDGEEQGEMFPMTAEWWGPDENGRRSNWSWDEDDECCPDDQIVAYRVVQS